MVLTSFPFIIPVNEGEVKGILAKGKERKEAPLWADSHRDLHGFE